MNEYIIQKASVVELADIVRSKIEVINEVNLIANRSQFNISRLSENITSIGKYAFAKCTNLTLASLPKNITNIDAYAFNQCENLTTITFKGTPTSIDSNAFSGCTNLTTINVPWSEGAVANAPWGANNATINYNYVEV